MPQEEVDRILNPLLDKIIPAYKNGSLDKMNEDFWAARAALTFSSGDHIDRGIFSIYLFNLVYLQKGEGVFQDAGIPHAYLEGQNVEIMANSDNVLRGGLTSKYIDVKELLRHVRCEPVVPAILRGGEVSDHVFLYKTPVNDFQLNVVVLNENDVVKATAGSTEILLVMEGAVRVNSDGPELEAGKPAAVILPGTVYTITGLTGTSTVFKASVPAQPGE